MEEMGGRGFEILRGCYIISRERGRVPPQWWVLRFIPASRQGPDCQANALARFSILSNLRDHEFELPMQAVYSTVHKRSHGTIIIPRRFDVCAQSGGPPPSTSRWTAGSDIL
ncbi:hypothetical protein ACLOJK_040146 [Asimina triloba]